jgi:hypothetical protein
MEKVDLGKRTFQDVALGDESGNLGTFDVGNPELARKAPLLDEARGLEGLIDQPTVEREFNPRVVRESHLAGA